jgi:hypothetical protein
MITQLAPFFYQQFFNINGQPLAGGTIQTYAAGTLIPLATYTDFTGVTPNTNPVVLDANGVGSIWISPTLGYKFVISDALGNVLRAVDNIYFIDPGSLDGSLLVPGSVGTLQLANLSVTQAKLALQSVGGNITPGAGQIIDGSITNVQIAPGTILGANIADDTVDTTELTDNILGIIAAGAYLNWTTQQSTILAGQATWQSIAYGNGVFIGVGIGGDVAISLDYGATWSVINSTFGQIWTSVAFGAGTFVVIGQGANSFMYSINNGQTWAASTIAGDPAFLSSICYGGGFFQAVVSRTGGGTPLIFFSNNGIAWTAATTPVLGAGPALGQVAYGNAGGVNAWIVTVSGTNNIWRSTDGMTWVAIAVGSTYVGGATSVTYGNGVWMLNSLVSSLDNGVTWADMPAANHLAPIGGQVPFDTIIYGNGCFLLFSYSNATTAAYMFFTKDLGASWQTTNYPSSPNSVVDVDSGLNISVTGSGSVTVSTADVVSGVCTSGLTPLVINASPGSSTSGNSPVNSTPAKMALSGIMTPIAYGQGIFVALGSTYSARSGMAIQTVS